MSDEGHAPDLPQSADPNATDRLLSWKEILEKGVAAHTTGRLDEAERLYRLVLEKDPREPNALTNLGTLFLQRGLLAQGVDFIKASLEVKPTQAPALNNLGNALTTLGRFKEAAEACRKAVELEPQNFDAFNNLGNALRELKQRDDAIAAYEEAIRLKPDFIVAMNNQANLLRELERHGEALAVLDRALALNRGAQSQNFRGNVLFDLNRPEDALSEYERAIVLDPEAPDIWRNKAITLLKLRRFDDALAAARKAIELAPKDPEALFVAGSALNDLKRAEEAIGLFEQAIALKPDYADAYNNLGNALQDLRRWDEALAVYERAQALRADLVPAFSNRGFVLREMGRFEEALAAYEQALALDPKFLDALNNKGVIFNEMRRFEDALAAFDEAIAVDPEFPDAQWNKSIMLILLERYAEGWPLYEWRWKRADVIAPIDLPVIGEGWVESHDLAGKTVVVRAEQGLGDSLQMLRYAPMLAARGAQVVLAVQSPLGEVASTVPGVSQVIIHDDRMPRMDHSLMTMSLPLAFGTTVPTIPATVPYIWAGKAEREAWAALLGPKSRLRIGLVWSGSRTHKNDHNRSIPLKVLAPILEADAEFVSLQIEYREEDEALLEDNGRIRRFDKQIKTFMDTAALIDQVDLVISVDTSVAHLAGAMGKLLWLLLPRSPDYRWHVDHPDSPWYPTARLFRQPGFGDWADVARTVADAIKTFSPPTGSAVDQAEQARVDQALAAFRKSRPIAEMRRSARALALEDKLEEALNLSRQVVARRPDFAEAHKDVGTILVQLERREEAVKAFQRAIRLEPAYVEALNEMGGSLRLLGRPLEALEALEAAKALRPDLSPIHGNIGNVYQDLGRFDDAHEAFETAAKLTPDLADAQWNLALLKLRLGHYSDGWRLYEWRWKREGLLAEDIAFIAPDWVRQTPLEGKTVLLRAEQGLGDTIQMLRYVPLLAARGAKVVLSVQPPLVEIARSIEGAAEVLPDTQVAPAYDHRCMIMSLPFAFGTTVETIPADVPYVHVSASARDRWAARLGTRRRLRVGLAWSGNPAQANDHNRTMPFTALAPLLDLDADFVSLQVTYRPGEQAAMEASGRVRSFHAEINDFMDTAALIEQLDLVVSVDTSAAHMAGALGKPVLLMLAQHHAYIWHVGRDDSPWYPTMRLFRQDYAGDWGSVIERVGARLSGLITPA